MKNIKTTWATPILLIAISSLVSCGGESHNIGSDKDPKPTSSIDKQLKQIINSNNLSGNPMQIGTPDISSKEAQLGMKLFYSKSLSAERDTACVTCHHPLLGGGDNLSLPIGTEAEDHDHLGLGRVHASNANYFDGGPTVPRNAPTTFNIAAWDQVMFHDGRIESIAKTKYMNGASEEGIRTPETSYGIKDENAGANLVQAQARFPITSAEEMKGFNDPEMDNHQIRNFLAQRLGNYGDATNLLSDPDYWLNHFREVYHLPDGSAEDLITEQTISFLIAQYERSQVFVETPWKSYIEGNTDALSAEAKKGALLFFNSDAEGGANCSSCHSGDFFTDEGFHNLAMPQIGRGKGDGDDGTNDFGRYLATKDPSDQFAFRTPSLINVEVTGPWSHAGAYTSLEAVIKHHLYPEEAINQFDTSQLSHFGIQNLEKIQANSEPAITADNFEGLSLNLNDTQVNHLVAFLKSLTDPCVKDKECLSRWIPDMSVDDDPNGDLLEMR